MKKAVMFVKVIEKDGLVPNIAIYNILTAGIFLLSECVDMIKLKLEKEVFMCCSSRVRDAHNIILINGLYKAGKMKETIQLVMAMRQNCFLADVFTACWLDPSNKELLKQSFLSS
jgi:hypothetical protein